MTFTEVKREAPEGTYLKTTRELLDEMGAYLRRGVALRRTDPDEAACIMVLLRRFNERLEALERRTM